MNQQLQPIAIHTSDRQLFRRCRRKWDWASPIRQSLGPISEEAGPLWLGSGAHFALEDYHGYNRFGHPTKAFDAYVKAYPKDRLPSDWEDLTELAKGILAYYADHWHARRGKEFRTLWVNGVPQVEVKFQVPIPGWENVVYAGTFDRLVLDPYDRLWVVDYKFLARYDINRLATDDQITSYTWAANQLYKQYGMAFEGVLFVQFVKDLPAYPQPLKTGGFSQNKNQKTTHAIYRKALIEHYGGVPTKYRDFLNYLASQETPEGDAFIRWDLVRRNEHQIAMQEWKIRAEVYEMMDPNLPLYPSPSRDCNWDCPFRSACIAMDDGSDWESIINAEFRRKQEIGEEWRDKIEWPAE